MSASETVSKPGGLRAETLLFGVIGLLLVVAAGYVMTQRQQALRASPAGFDGLQAWLTSEDISTQSFLGGWQLDQNSVDLLVLPLFDTALDRDRTAPRTKQDLLLQQDEYDLALDDVREKIRRVPSLVVLPKWRSGMRLTGVAHPFLLSDPEHLNDLLSDITGNDAARLGTARGPFSEFTYQDAAGDSLTAQLYVGQTFSSPGCTPLIGTPDAMVLADCPVAGETSETSVLILSDPDLLNNHGLRMASNAAIARDIFDQHQEDGNIVIDYSRRVWLMDPDRGVVRERSWADLKRFFDPPFLVLWMGAGGLFLLALWRGQLRYGPVQAERQSHMARPDPSQAKPPEDVTETSLALAAQARMLRRTDQDGAMVREYARARLAACAGALFGPALARHYAQPDRFTDYVARRNPERSDALKSVLKTIQTLPPRLSPAEAIQQVNALETLLEQITNDT